MDIKELVIAIVVAHTIMNLAKFVVAFAVYMVYATLCETNKEFCKQQLDSSRESVRNIAQKVYKRKWEPIEKVGKEVKDRVIGFNRFTIDG